MYIALTVCAEIQHHRTHLRRKWHLVAIGDRAGCGLTKCECDRRQRERERTVPQCYCSGNDRDLDHVELISSFMWRKTLQDWRPQTWMWCCWTLVLDQFSLILFFGITLGAFTKPGKRSRGNLWPSEAGVWSLLNHEGCSLCGPNRSLRLIFGNCPSVCRQDPEETEILRTSDHHTSFHVYLWMLFKADGYHLTSLSQRVWACGPRSWTCTDVGTMWSSTRRIRPNGRWYATSTLWWNKAHCCRYAAPVCVCVRGGLKFSES